MALGYGNRARADKRLRDSARIASQSAAMPGRTRNGVPLKYLSFLILSALLIGCATSTRDQQTQVSGMTCWKELPVGSNLPVTKCMTEDEMKRKQQAVDAMSDEIMRATPHKSRGNGT